MCRRRRPKDRRALERHLARVDAQFWRDIESYFGREFVALIKANNEAMRRLRREPRELVWPVARPA